MWNSVKYWSLAIEGDYFPVVCPAMVVMLNLCAPTCQWPTPISQIILDGAAVESMALEVAFDYAGL